MIRESTTCDLKDLVNKFVPNVLGRQIESACQGIYPLNNVFIRKVKMLKAPKFDAFRLADLYTETSNTASKDKKAADTGAKVEKPKA
jgi:small subunit ribosomal protein S3Ae